MDETHLLLHKGRLVSIVRRVLSPPMTYPTRRRCKMPGWLIVVCRAAPVHIEDVLRPTSAWGSFYRVDYTCLNPQLVLETVAYCLTLLGFFEVCGLLCLLCSFVKIHERVSTQPTPNP